MAISTQQVGGAARTTSDGPHQVEGWERRMRQIAYCRICGNAALEPVIDLGTQSLASLFNDGRRDNQLDTPIPLEVVRCDTIAAPQACGFVQLRHTVPPDVLYRDYGYRSGINTTMRHHLRDLVREIETRWPLRDGDLVVDIGANDGTTLMSYAHPRIIKIGVEPSNVRPQVADHGIRYIPNVFRAADFNARFPRDRARVITSIAMFYDLDDPIEFCRELGSILADDGVWVLELSYLGAMLEHNTFDAICHEHLGYYSLRTLHYVFERAELALYDLSFNRANGGSVRCFVTKRAGGHRVPTAHQARIETALREESAKGYHDCVQYDDFRQHVRAIQRDLRDTVERAIAAGQRVYGYGASTKGNVVLQYCGFGPQHLIAIADRNPAKVGRTTLGTKIPICSEETMRQARPDYLLIFPWHFLDEFLVREQALRAAGTRFIVPFPQVRIV